MSLAALDARQREIVRVCLRVAADAPEVFPDAEFHTIFGLHRDSVRAVADAWPDVDDADEDVDLAVNNALNNLLGYPHGRHADWAGHFAFTRIELADTLAAWRGSGSKGYFDALR